jgi:hypothetical protein
MYIPLGYVKVDTVFLDTALQSHDFHIYFISLMCLAFFGHFIFIYLLYVYVDRSHLLIFWTMYAHSCHRGVHSLAVNIMICMIQLLL